MSSSTLTARLRDMGGAAVDLSDLAEPIAAAFHEAVEEHFDSQGSGTWAPWARSYAGRAVGRMLVASGELLDSLTDPGHRQHILRVTGRSIEVGTKRPTATLHRHASGSESHGMPAREPLPPRELFEARWAEAVAGHLDPDAGGRLGL